MSDAVLTEARGRTLVITLNRPTARNAIDQAMADGIADAVHRLDTSDDLTAAVLTGAGRGFCAGLDLKAFASTGAPRHLLDFLRNGAAKPLVAAVEGFALAGGLELALACDIVVAAEETRLGLPEVTVGLMAAGGALVRLAQHLPYGSAMAMVLSGEPMSATDAYRHGLVARLTDPGKALDAAVSLAARIGHNAPLAVAASKRMIKLAQGRTEEALWDLQKPFVKRVFRSADAAEGARAFVEKREPIWTGG